MSSTSKKEIAVFAKLPASFKEAMDKIVNQLGVTKTKQVEFGLRSYFNDHKEILGDKLLKKIYESLFD